MANAFVDIEAARRNRERLAEEREKERKRGHGGRRWGVRPPTLVAMPIREIEEGESVNEKSVSNEHVIPVQDMTRLQKHVYFEQHKAEMIADFVSSGCSGVAIVEKWGISGPGWYGLTYRWAADIAAAKADMPSLPDKPVLERRAGARSGNKNALKDGYYSADGKKLNYKQLYVELTFRFAGYRQAVMDMMGQTDVDILGQQTDNKA